MDHSVRLADSVPVGGPDPRGPVAAVGASTVWILAPVLLAVDLGLGRTVAEAAGEFPADRRAPLCGIGVGDREGLGFLDEADEDARRP